MKNKITLSTPVGLPKQPIRIQSTFVPERKSFNEIQEMIRADKEHSEKIALKFTESKQYGNK